MKKVIGVELCKQAVEDAKVNAKNNGNNQLCFKMGKEKQLKKVVPVLKLNYSVGLYLLCHT